MFFKKDDEWEDRLKEPKRTVLQLKGCPPSDHNVGIKFFLKKIPLFFPSDLKTDQIWKRPAAAENPKV